MRGLVPPRERPLHWIGSSRKDLLTFPRQVIADMGYLLGVVQLGGMPTSAKPWKGGRVQESSDWRRRSAVMLKAAREDYEARHGQEG